MAIIRQELAKLGITPHLTVIGMRDNHGEAPQSDQSVDVFVIDGRSILSPSGYWKLLGALDCVIDIGAGDSFSQIYGPKRFAYLWTTKALALLRRVPLVLAPQTVGPFTGLVYRKLAKIVMERAQYVVARDGQSFAITEKIAPGATVGLATDVAFELPFVRPSRHKNCEDLRIGVNVSGLLYRQAETGENRFGLSYNYATFVHALLERLLDLPGAKVQLIAHANSRTDPGDDDGALADRLATVYPGVERVLDFPDARAAKSYISGLDFLIAGRMHACIAAFSSGVPVIPTAYSRKFSGLFGSLGYGRIVTEQGFTQDEAVEFVLAQIAMRELLKTEISAAMDDVSSRLGVYRMALRSLFERSWSKLDAG